MVAKHKCPLSSFLLMGAISLESGKLTMMFGESITIRGNFSLINATNYMLLHDLFKSYRIDILSHFSTPFVHDATFV